MNFLVSWAKRHFTFESEVSMLNRKNLFKEIDSKLQLITTLAFIVGFTLTLPIVYIENLIIDYDFFEKYSIFLLVIAIFSTIEIFILYKLGFFAINLIAKSVNLDFKNSENLYVMSLDDVLSRLVLEISEPNAKLFGIDLDEHIDKKHKIMLAILYKAKIIITNAILKALLRRVITTNSLRTYINYISAPVTGFWDSIITYFIVKEAKFRVASYLYLDELLEQKKRFLQSLDRDTKELILLSIAYAIVSNRHYHPNLQFLLLKTHRVFDIEIDDLNSFDTLKTRLQDSKHRELIESFFIFALFANGKIKKYKLKIASDLEVDRDSLDSKIELIKSIKESNIDIASFF